MSQRARKKKQLHFFFKNKHGRNFLTPLRCDSAFVYFFLINPEEKKTKSSSPQQLVVSNYDGKLEVGVAFQLLLRDLPVRRGIVMSIDPTTKEPHVWYQDKSVKRGPGESQDLFGMYHGFFEDDIPKLVITPVPGVFNSWLSRVPAQVRIACGSLSVRPGRKVGVPAVSNMIHPDLASSPGCSPPRSLSPSEEVKNSRVSPMTSQLAQLRVVLDKRDNKLDEILNELEKLEKA